MARILVVRPPRERPIAVLRVERSSRQTLNWFSRPAMQRRTVEIDILRRRAASEMLLASTTLANIASELGSVIFYPTYGNVILGFST
jgi:hypothetical protein